MPTYEYRCNQCDHEFEAFQSITASPLRQCPACGKRSLKRLIGTGAALLFKGDGFYQTDYRSDSYHKAAKADTSASSSSSSSSGDKASGSGSSDSSSTSTSSTSTSKSSTPSKSDKA